MFYLSLISPSMIWGLTVRVGRISWKEMLKMWFPGSHPWSTESDPQEVGINSKAYEEVWTLSLHHISPGSCILTSSPLTDRHMQIGKSLVFRVCVHPSKMCLPWGVWVRKKWWSNSKHFNETLGCVRYFNICYLILIAQWLSETGINKLFYRWSGEGDGNPLQYSCLENLMGRGAWQATVTKSQTWLKQLSTDEEIKIERLRYSLGSNHY